MRLGTTAALLLLGGMLAQADFSYQQKTQITGGSLVKMMKILPGAGKAVEPQYSRLYFQKNRMATVTDREVDIIDLAAGRVIHVDLEKKTYSVITFEEFRKAMDAMAQQMAKQMGSGQQAVMDMRLSVKEGGETRTIQNLPAKLMKLLLEMDMKDQKSGQTFTSTIEIDEWRTPAVPGYDEVRAFYMAYAEKVGISPESLRTMRMAMGQAGTAEGMAKLAQEAAKLEGVPLVQVTRMTGLGVDIPDIQMPSGAEMGGAAAESAAGAALGRLGRLGGLGGFGRRKKQEEPAPAPKKAEPAAGAPKSVLLEATTELSDFSTAAVDASRFSIPAGFREVEHEMKKILRESSKK
ncbi:MAG: hypothetical protein N2036_09895 [Bryobacteraceae bacterium]|nr:hypothetical protein [Bryobacteraceae bacterium]